MFQLNILCTRLLTGRMCRLSRSYACSAVCLLFLARVISFTLWRPRLSNLVDNSVCLCVCMCVCGVCCNSNINYCGLTWAFYGYTQTNILSTVRPRTIKSGQLMHLGERVCCDSKVGHCDLIFESYSYTYTNRVRIKSWLLWGLRQSKLVS